MNPRFDLVDIARTLMLRARYLLFVTLAAGALGCLFYLLQKKQYKSNSEFFVANPNYTDRNNLFRTDRAQFIDYFGTEDDIDKVMAIAKSELAKSRIIERTGLAKAYGMDTASEQDRLKLYNRFMKSYDAKRTEYQNMEVSYTDPDPKLAAYVANEAVRVIEEIYGGYFSTLRNHVQQSIQSKLQETDSAIVAMTDSLALLRDQYHIYDIISPSRQVMISGGLRASTGPGFGKAIEQVQNIESIKDQLVVDRSHYASLISEFSTGTKAGELPLLQVISQAYPPSKPAGLGLLLTTLACLLAGLVFSALWVLLAAYFRLLTTASR